MSNALFLDTIACGKEEVFDKIVYFIVFKSRYHQGFFFFFLSNDLQGYKHPFISSFFFALLSFVFLYIFINNIVKDEL
jgi:hypothetical protein